MRQISMLFSDALFTTPTGNRSKAIVFSYCTIQNWMSDVWR
jgi:hypothetical protein